MIMSSASRTMVSCVTKMRCGYRQFPGQLFPTGVKSNCRLYHARRLLLLLPRRPPSSLRMRSGPGAMPPSVGILRSGSARLKPSCCQLRRGWPVMQLGLHQWPYAPGIASAANGPNRLRLHRRHRMTLAMVTSYHRFVILNSLTGAGFLQLEHTAPTRTVRLKPHTTTPTLHRVCHCDC